MAMKHKPTVVSAIVYGASAGIIIYMILWLIELGYNIIWGLI